jgi:hypothetical protein
MHPRLVRNAFEDGADAHADARGAVTRSDLIFTSDQWTSIIVGRLSPWLDLDSPLEALRRNSELVRTLPVLFVLAGRGVRVLAAAATAATAAVVAALRP